MIDRDLIGSPETVDAAMAKLWNDEANRIYSMDGYEADCYIDASLPKAEPKIAFSIHARIKRPPTDMPINHENLGTSPRYADGARMQNFAIDPKSELGLKMRGLHAQVPTHEELMRLIDEEVATRKEDAN